MSNKQKNPLREGWVKKGGVNPKPSTPKQPIKPPPQKPSNTKSK